MATDGILGLPDLDPETKEKYSLRKVVGCGDVAAETILRGCSTIKELFERVVETYKEYYKDSVTDVQGIPYTWKEYLRENALLLWMQRKKDQRFDIFTDLLDKLGIDYKQEETNNGNN